jgi:hypothetical protein
MGKSLRTISLIVGESIRVLTGSIFGNKPAHTPEEARLLMVKDLKESGFSDEEINCIMEQAT